VLAGATVARWELHPLKNHAFARRTDIQGSSGGKSPPCSAGGRSKGPDTVPTPFCSLVLVGASGPLTAGPDVPPHVGKRSPSDSRAGRHARPNLTNIRISRDTLKLRFASPHLTESLG
jgi:hypothetical protein